MPDYEATAVKTVKNDVHEILDSGKYYVTPELTGQLRSIQTDLNHLGLDSKLLRTSEAWRNSKSANGQNGNLYASLGDAQRVLSNVKGQLDSKAVSQMQANQIRAAHHKSMEGLINVRLAMQQHAQKAKDNIDRFSDHIGVTDRYTGYRSNLTRGSRDPFKLDSYWLRELGNQKVKFDETGINRGLSAPQQQSFDQYQTSKLAASMRESVRSPTKVQFQSAPQLRPHTTPEVSKQEPTKSIQEACGINTTYPGKTEYMTRYNRPPSLNMRKTSEFTINPIPDYLIYGRPIAKMVYEQANTEYQSRYEWPDGRKIIKLPWLRK